MRALPSPIHLAAACSTGPRPQNPHCRAPPPSPSTGTTCHGPRRPLLHLQEPSSPSQRANKNNRIREEKKKKKRQASSSQWSACAASRQGHHPPSDPHCRLACTQPGTFRRCLPLARGAVRVGRRVGMPSQQWTLSSLSTLDAYPPTCCAIVADLQAAHRILLPSSASHAALRHSGHAPVCPGQSASAS